MNCPGCSSPMTDMSLAARMNAAPPVDFDVCTACQAFWFDVYKSPQLSAGSTLKLMKFISEHPPTSAVSMAQNLRCPRCSIRLVLTHDLQKATRFTYWSCPQEHGHFIGFVDFLREKDFIHPLSPQQINELRQNIQIVNCSNCGAPIDLAVSSVCGHCGSPLSLLDMHQPQRMLNQLQDATESQKMDVNLFVELAQTKLEQQSALDLLKAQPLWLGDVTASGLVHACLKAVARWIGKIEL